MGDYWLLLLEIAIALSLAFLYLSARKAFSAEDVRRTMITENERLKRAIEQLSEEFEDRIKSALSALDEAAERAEKLARRLEEFSAAGSARTGGPLARNTAALGEKHKDVVALARQGMSIESIAKQVELGTGEVELVLNIHKEEQNPF